MENLTLNPTSRTPFVLIDSQKGLLEIRGNSIPENAVSFYNPVMDWVNSAAESPLKAINAVIQLDYFNTSSARCLAELFNKLHTLHSSGKTSIAIYWEYKSYDEDSLEAGEDFQAIAKVPFHIVKID